MTTAPEFHLYFPQMRVPMDALVEKAQAAEAAGFTGMAGMDHLAPPQAEQQPMYEALTTNAWLLAHTERLRQSQLVLADPFRHPAVLARELVTLDHASNGRIELGIGAGSIADEFVTYGVQPAEAAERVARLRESLEILRALWTGDVIDHDGEWFQLNAARQEPTPLGTIPIVIGGTGPKMMQLVAEFADWWNVPIHQLDRLDTMRERAGSARVSVQHMYAFVPDGADRAAIEEPARRRFGTYGPNLVVGGRSETLDHIHALQARGVERFYVWFADFAPPETLRGFGAEVITSFG